MQKVSFQLDQDSAFDMGQFVAARVGEALGRGVARAAADTSGTYGSGTGMPTSVYSAISGYNSGSQALALTTSATLNAWHAVASGTSNAGNVTELAANALSPATILALISKVDPAYRKLGAKFYMSDAQRIGTGSILDGYGRPLFPELLSDNPSLFNYPVVVDNNVPALTASTIGGPVFGHLSSAMVMRTVKPEGAASVGLLRLSERYADFLQVGFIGYMRYDLRANDVRAIATVKASTA